MRKKRKIIGHIVLPFDPSTANPIFLSWKAPFSLLMQRSSVYPIELEKGQRKRAPCHPPHPPFPHGLHLPIMIYSTHQYSDYSIRLGTKICRLQMPKNKCLCQNSTFFMGKIMEETVNALHTIPFPLPISLIQGLRAQVH